MQRRIWLQRVGGEGRISLFEELFLQEDQNAWSLRGWSYSFFSARIDSLGKKEIRSLWFLLWLQIVSCQLLQYSFTGDIYIYIYSIFCYANVFIISIDLIILFYNIYVCRDSFNELCKYIIYNLSTYAGLDLLLYHVVNLVLSSIYLCGIYVYCAILFNFEFFFEYVQDCNTVKFLAISIPV